MHIVELFEDLAGSPQVQVKEASLPNTIGGGRMHGGREAKAIQRLPAPRLGWVFAEKLENLHGGSNLQRTDNVGRVDLGVGPEEKMKVLGHENVTDQLELQGVAHLAHGTNPEVLEGLRVKHTDAAVSAGGDEMRVVKAVVPGRAGHRKIVFDRRHAWADDARSRRHAEKRASAPPAGSRCGLCCVAPSELNYVGNLRSPTLTSTQAIRSDVSGARPFATTWKCGEGFRYP